MLRNHWYPKSKRVNGSCPCAYHEGMRETGSTADECTWSAACSGHSTQRDKLTATQAWQAQRADLDSLEKLTLPVNIDKNKFSH
jgi:hypothetical protein